MNTKHKNCGICQVNLNNLDTYCMRERSSVQEHYNCWHPMLCSDKCRQIFMANYLALSKEYEIYPKY